MLYREIIAVCSVIHTKHVNTLCGQNVALLSVKPGGTKKECWASEGLQCRQQTIILEYCMLYSVVFDFL
jgi:hypothetical protein